MNDFKTRELLYKYFDETMPDEKRVYTSSLLDKKELYNYEEEINKPITEMEPLEIRELLIRISNNNYGLGRVNISYRTYSVALVSLRAFFEWYIDNIKLIKNPCNSKILKPSDNMNLFIDSDDLMTYEHIEQAIGKIREEQVEPTADYWEAIIRMFYEGFPNVLSFVKFKKSDMDFENKIAQLERCNIKLTDRLFDLLVAINERERMPFAKGSCDFLSYHDSFFKFPVLKKRLEVFETLPENEIAGHITRVLNKNIRPYFNVTVDARSLYLCGFYDWLVKQLSIEEVKNIITVPKNSENITKLREYAQRYGVIESNITALKKILLPYTMK